MAQRAIREYEAKRIFFKNWTRYFSQFQGAFRSVSVSNGQELAEHAKQEEHSWLTQNPLVVKPDMIFGKRGLNDLVLHTLQKPGDVTLDEAIRWIEEQRARRTTLLSGQSGILSRFIVEPFLPHHSNEEHYISAFTASDADVLCLSAKGGINIEKHWEQVVRLELPALADETTVTESIRTSLPEVTSDQQAFADFAVSFYQFFRDLNFAYLEINPFVLTNGHVHLLDLVAKVDDTAGYLMAKRWGPLYFPTPFGMKAPGPEEKAIRKLDEKSGASLKLTVLNPAGRVWTLVAGGGASVVYADTIADLLGANELANYGEYSGNPTTQETYLYAVTLLELMTREPHPSGKAKILLIGGAIANFTDVAKTFTGIIRAFEEYHERMKNVGTHIYVRRGGPNYEVGLRKIKETADRLQLPIEVYGPETHMTEIVRMAQAV